MDLALVDGSPTFVSPGLLVVGATHFASFKPETALRPFAAVFVSRLTRALLAEKLDLAAPLSVNSQFTFRGAVAHIAAKLLSADSGRKRFSQCLDGDEGAISRAFGILTGLMGNLQGWLNLHAVIGKATASLIGPLTASLAGRDKLLTRPWASAPCRWSEATSPPCSL